MRTPAFRPNPFAINDHSPSAGIGCERHRKQMADLAQVLFLLVGRGGSKGLPGKNLCEIGGLSLIGYKAKAALQSRHCSRLIVSSDSAEIRDEAMRHGAEMLFERPAELATDTASSNDVILHAMDWIETHEKR